MPRRHAAAPVRAATVALCALAAGGCGGDDGGVDAKRATAAGAALLADAQAAMARVGSYHLTGSSTTRAGARTTIEADVSAAGGGAMAATIVAGGARAEVVVTAGKGYVKGDRAFWGAGKGDAAADALAARLAGRWTTEPEPDPETGLAAQLGRLAPAGFARCLAVGHGPVTNAGARSAGGVRVVVLRDAGGRAGTAPGELSIAAKGAPLVLRLRQTGPRAAGGTLDRRCQTADDRDVAATDYRLSAFGEPVSVTAPPKPLDYDTVLGEVVADIL